MTHCRIVRRRFEIVFHGLQTDDKDEPHGYEKRIDMVWESFEKRFSTVEVQIINTLISGLSL